MTDAPTPKPQIDKFRDLARELECDDDEAAFDERLKKLAKAPRDAYAELERRLSLARVERDAWKGKPGEHYQMAEALVRGLERQIEELANAKPADKPK